MGALNEEHPEHDPERPPPGRRFTDLASKMSIGFGLVFVATLLCLKAIELYGLPFSSFRGLIEERRTEVVKSLNLTADLKKERLLRWLEERRDDAAVLTNSAIVRSQVGYLTSAVNRKKRDGRVGEKLWDDIREDKVYLDLREHLSLVRETYGVYQNIQVVDALSGTIIAGTDGADLGEEVPHREEIAKAVDVGTTIIAVQRMKPGDDLHLHLIAPFPAEGGLQDSGEKSSIGVLIMHVDTDDFISPMLHKGGGLGKTGEALLVDRDVRILTSLSHPLADGTRAEPLRYRIAALPATRAARGEEGIIATADYRGEEVLAAYRHLPISEGMGWGMVVKRDQAEIFQQFRIYNYHLALISLIGVFLILGFTGLLARNLARPIRNLSQTAQRVRKGDLGARAHPGGTGEVKQLAIDFNSMVERVQHWHRELDEQVARRTMDLNQKKEELECEIEARKSAQKTRDRLNSALQKKNEEMEDVMSVTSHDLRSPLVNIHGFSRELKHLIKEVASLSGSPEIPPAVADKIRPLVNKEIPESLDFILRGASKMDRLLKGLLQLSRLGRAALQIEVLDMDRILSEIGGVMEFQTRELKARLECAPLPPCLGDEGQVNQVFSNLIDNALKYLDPGRRGVIRVSGTAENGQTVYRVEDNGIGIDPDHYDKIFQIFQRLELRGVQGDGLGLTAVRRILERQNGRIWVESTPGEGCVFSVSLPSPARQKGGNAE